MGVEVAYDEPATVQVGDDAPAVVRRDVYAHGQLAGRAGDPLVAHLRDGLGDELWTAPGHCQRAVSLPRLLCRPPHQRHHARRVDARKHLGQLWVELRVSLWLALGVGRCRVGQLRADGVDHVGGTGEGEVVDVVP